MKLKTISLALFVFSILSFSLSVDAKDKASADSKINHWRVIWKQDPQTTATISWSTVTAGKSHLVHYDVKERKAIAKKYKSKKKAHRSGSFSGSEDKKYFHHVKLEKLKPSTTYYFMIKSDDAVTQEFHFTTAPKDDRAFKILFGGDSRSGVNARIKINNMVQKMHAEDESILALAHGGDYVNSGKSWGQWDRWMTNHELFADDNGLILPIIPARGNHDGGPLYKEIFDLTDAETCYYVTQLSKEVTLVTLDTNISAAGQQLNFLDKSLKDNKKIKWLMAQYHRPIYPAVKTPFSGKKQWTALFDKYNMDLALEADGHAYKRTVPIKNDKQDPKGVVYVGEGCMGVGLRKPKTTHWYLQKPGAVDTFHHVMKLEFTKKTLNYSAISETSEVKDSYVITAKKR